MSKPSSVRLTWERQAGSSRGSKPSTVNDQDRKGGRPLELELELEEEEEEEEAEAAFLKRSRNGLGVGFSTTGCPILSRGTPERSRSNGRSKKNSNKFPFAAEVEELRIWRYRSD